MTEDDEGESMFDIMNKRMIELEIRLIKTENKNKKLTSVTNKYNVTIESVQLTSTKSP